jgi:hypothetical protein
MITNAHHVFETFLAGSGTAVVPDDDHALELFEHAAHCPACAAKLSEKPEHALALIGARERAESRKPTPWSARDDEILQAGQQEVVTLAEELIAREPELVNGSARRPASEEERARLWLVGADVSPEVFRVALGVSEAVLVLQSLISEHDELAVVVSEASFGDLNAGDAGGMRVPASYLASRIAEHAGLLPADAALLWRSLVGRLRESGSIGGVHAEAARRRGSSRPPAERGVRDSEARPASPWPVVTGALYARTTHIRLYQT